MRNLPAFFKSLTRSLPSIALALGLVVGMFGAFPAVSSATTPEATTANVEDGNYGRVYPEGVTVNDEYTLTLHLTNSDGCGVAHHPVLIETANTVEITMERNEVPRPSGIMCTQALRPYTEVVSLEQPLNGRAIYIDGLQFEPVYEQPEPEIVVEQPISNEMYPGYRVNANDQYNLRISIWHHNGCGPDIYPIFVETSTSVRVYMMPNYPPRSRDIMCTQAFREFHYEIGLQQPLGDRQVIIDGVDYTPAAM